MTVTESVRKRLMYEAMLWLVRKFGRETGIMLFVVDSKTTGGKFSYQSNMNRPDAVYFLKEWFRLNSGEPTQGTEEMPTS